MDYKAWVQVYWSQFQVVRFQQRFSDDSGDYLVLPEIFVKNAKVKLSKLAILKTNASTWPLKLAVDEENGNVLITKGWKDFVKAHCLKKDDILIFEYRCDQQSALRVSMYDGQTLGENPSGFFVRRERFLQVEANDDVEPRGDPKEKTNKRKAQQKEDHDRPSTSRSAARKKSKTAYEDKRERIGTDDTRSSKEKTMSEANKLRKDGDVVVYMNLTCIKTAKLMLVSTVWAREHGLSQSQDVELHCGEEDPWPARFYFSEEGRPIAGISRGWKQFVEDTGLKVGDACIFRVLPRSVRGAGGCVCIDVRIVKACDDKREPVRKGVPGKCCGQPPKAKEVKEPDDDSDSDDNIQQSARKKARPGDGKRSPVGGDSKTKDQTLKKANAMKKDGEAVVYMSPSCVDPKGYAAGLTTRWAKDHGLDRTQEVELHCNGNMWPVKFYSDAQEGRVAAFRSGWKQFAVENGLKVGDACIVNVLPRSVRGAGGCVCVDVRIVKACHDERDPVRRGVPGKRCRGQPPKPKEPKEPDDHSDDSDDNNQQSARKKARSACDGKRSPVGRGSKTMKDRNRTLEKANEMKEDGETVLYMSPSFNQRGGVSCSSVWARDHVGLDSKQEVELHCKGKAWDVDFYLWPEVRKAAFRRGWKKFVTENRIKVGDACILGSSGRCARGRICIDVRIVKGVSESED